MEVVGIIKVLGATQEIGAKGFKKREVVITTAEDYPQMLSIEFTQDKVDLLNEFMEGSSVTISINLRGREWVNPAGEAKYFNSLQGWKIAQA
jgi:hypothetical protein